MRDRRAATTRRADDGCVDTAVESTETSANAAGIAGSTHDATPDAAFTYIRAVEGWASLNLRELWSSRELVYFLAWRDIKVRYKQTALGVAWAVLQPLFAMTIFSVFLGKLARVPSDGVPYPIFSFAALVPWTFFAHGLSQAADSLVSSQNLIKKVYFPRLAIPIATVASGVVDFALALLVLLGMMVLFGMAPTLNAFWIVPLVALALVAALGAGLWLAALNVKYRDVRYVVPFLTQAWLFATPVVYPSSLLGEPWKTLYGLNPLAGTVEGFRWALLGTPAPSASMLAASAFAAVVLLVSGTIYFRRVEARFADII